jgi:hypothetical protein
MFQLIGRSRCGGYRMLYRRASSSSEVVRLYRPHIGSILNQIFRSIQRFPQSLKSVGIIAFALFFDGGVSEAAYRGAQTFDRFVANPEGFCQSVFQGFALSIEGLLGRWRNRNVSGVGENQAKSLQNIPTAQPALCGPPELARSVPRARPSVFSRNAIAGQSPAATALSSIRSSFLTEWLPSCS